MRQRRSVSTEDSYDVAIATAGCMAWNEDKNKWESSGEIVCFTFDVYERLCSVHVNKGLLHNIGTFLLLCVITYINEIS